jgi:hypothetical protein
MLFGERLAVCCENHTEHTDTVRTSQETHYVSATGANRLILFGETAAVYCGNHTERTGILGKTEVMVLVFTTGLVGLDAWGSGVLGDWFALSTARERWPALVMRICSDFN